MLDSCWKHETNTLHDIILTEKCFCLVGLNFTESHLKNALRGRPFEAIFETNQQPHNKYRYGFLKANKQGHNNECSLYPGSLRILMSSSDCKIVSKHFYEKATFSNLCA